MAGQRDNFTQAVKTAVALRVHHQCCFPACGVATVGPSANSKMGVAIVGVAAHITAAAPGGPRYDPSLTPEQRSSIDNAIWLCATHGTLIDRDDTRFPTDLLKQWKSDREQATQQGLGSPIGVNTEKHDAEIDEARTLLRARDFETAKILLERKQSREWDQLNSRQRFRVLANLGTAARGKGNSAQAAALFVESSYYQPDDADAQAFLALGHELSGDRVTAFAIADSLVRDRSCKRAAGILVRCAPPEVTLASLETRTKLWQSDYEVLVALTVRSINYREYEVALRHAHLLDQLHNDTPDGPLLEGRAQYARVANQFHVSSRGRPTGVSLAELRDAEAALGEAYNRAKRHQLYETCAVALLVRYEVRKILGDEAAALADLEQAGRLRPNDPEVLVARAVALGPGGRPQAIGILRDAVTFGGGDRASMVLGLMLKEENQLHEAAVIFRKMAEGESNLREDAACLLFDIVLAESRDRAEGIVPLALDLDACLGATFQAETALASGLPDIAGGFATEALAAARSSIPVAAVRRRLAALLSRLGDHASAFSIWESLFVPGMYSPDLQELLRSALALEKHDFVLSVCAAVRANGEWVPELVRVEAGLLEKYEPEKAYALLKEHLARHPDDRIAALRLSYTCLRTDRTAEAVTDLDRLPEPEGSLEAASYTISLLRLLGLVRDALAYSYDVLRAHWESPDAHLVFFTTHVETEETDRPPSPEVVSPGCAVCYRELSADSPERWLIIEEGGTIYSKLDEVAPDTLLASLFIGRRSGEVVSLTDGLQPRRVELVRVVHKYTHRWQQCMDEYQLRFPHRNEVQSLRLGNDDQPFEEQFAPLLRAADRRAERVTDVLGVYKESPLTLFALCEGLGVDSISGQIGLARDPEIRVRACLNDAEAHKRKVAHISAASTVVLDASAIGTILLLGLADSIASWRWTLSTTYSTRDLIEDFVRRHTDNRARGVFGRSGDRYVFETGPNDSWIALAASASKLREICTPLPVAELAKMEPPDRERLVSLHGLAGAESIVASTVEGRVLWSDDATMVFTSERHGGAAAGVQAILQAAHERDHLAASRLHELTAQLLVLRYETTWFNDQVTHAAAQLAEYRPTHEPLSSIVKLLSDDGFAPLKAAAAALLCIREVARNLVLPASREAAINPVVASLARRTNGRALVRRMSRSIMPAFGLDVLRGHEALKTVDAWLAHSELVDLNE
jgi:tetratricopeptide (TPR) repeat protein